MITEEEKKEIIEAAVEKAMLSLPSVMGNLMTEHATMMKMNSEFYTQYPEFKDHKQEVVASIEHCEGQNPLLPYKDLLKKAVPEIKQRVLTMGKLDMKDVTESPNRTAQGLI